MEKHEGLWNSSLVPGPPPFFFFSVCIQHNTQSAEEREKRGRPGNTYHMNDVWWMRGGRRGGLAHHPTCVQ